MSTSGMLNGELNNATQRIITPGGILTLPSQTNTLGINTIKEAIFYPIGLANSANYLVQNIGASGNLNFNFFIPSDFVALAIPAGQTSALKIIGSAAVAGAVGAGKSMTAASDYALSGQLRTTNSASVGLTVTIPEIDTFFEVPINTAFTALAANQYCGVKLTHNAIGGSVNYYFLKMSYRYQ